MRIALCKQRHGHGSLGEITGWFHRDKRQFQLEQFAKGTRYLPEDAYT